MGNLSQATRMGSLRTPLGEDVLVLKGFTGYEAVGDLFEFDVECLSEQENISFDNAIGQPCTLKLKTYNNKERFFCGVLTEAEWTGRDPEYHGDREKYYAYRLVLRPWFWLLGHRADCRIFLEKKVTDIIQDVFTKAGFASGTDFRMSVQSQEKIDYCVQYRESDFTFVSRLMEQYGIYYFFEHKDGQHTMVLADSRSVHKAIPDLPQLKYNPSMGGYNRQEQNALTWVSGRRFRTGKIQYNDYDYLTPPKDLFARKEGSETYKHSKFEVYDYPGKYVEKDKGENFAQFRLEAEQGLDHRRHADGDAPSLFAGGLTTLQQYPSEAENKEYLVVRANHRFGNQSYSAGAHSAAGYSGSYEFQLSDRQFRSLPLTPKPRIYGIQTAKVVGKQGEDSQEISTDEHGRIWVKFYWDREPQKTCPIRVAQVWSGKNWGGQFIPRIGMEVVVEFLEGDPDRPLVTGCVFNGDNKYPWALPANKTQSGIKSDSSRGHQGYNEFMFEDKSGSEFIRMHAQKDHLVTILNDQTGSVGANQTWTVKDDRSWTIKQGNDYLNVKQGNLGIDVDMGNYNLDVKMGNISVKADLGSITVEAMQSITLKVGESSVKLDQMGVTIKGMMIQIEGQVQTQVKGVMTQVTGDAMLQLSGGIIMVG